MWFIKIEPLNCCKNEILGIGIGVQTGRTVPNERVSQETNTKEMRASAAGALVAPAVL